MGRVSTAEFSTLTRRSGEELTIAKSLNFKNPENVNKVHQSKEELDTQHEEWLQILGDKLMLEVHTTTPNLMRINALTNTVNAISKVIKTLREDVRGIVKEPSEGLQIPTGFSIKLIGSGGKEIEISKEGELPKLDNQDPHLFDDSSFDLKDDFTIVDAEEVK